MGRWGNVIMWWEKLGKFELQENSRKIQSIGCIFVHLYHIYCICFLAHLIVQTLFTLSFLTENHVVNYSSKL